MSETFDDSREPRPARGLAYAPHLVVLLECDRPVAGVARYSLEGIERVTIGRGEPRRISRASGHLEVRIPGRSMSSTHARLLRTGTAWAIEDAGSRNGTLVNGVRVERAVLGHGDLLEVGHTLLRVDPSVGLPLDAPFDVDLPGSPEGNLTTLDPTFAANLEKVARLAPSDVPILLAGDSGVGKEVVARWVHRRAHRTGEFVAVNCGGIPCGLVEGQLFGHVKGAFSGAVRSEPGLVRRADGGTLFLDEVGDLPAASQAALLRVLQEREVVPVGETRPTSVSVRLVSATHRDLEDMVAQGEFRRDLFARIAGCTLPIPRLGDRRDDLGILIAALIPKLAGDAAAAIAIAPDAGRAILSYDWPLNVRELRHCLETCITLAAGNRIERWHLPPKVLSAIDTSARPSPSAPLTLDERDNRLRVELLAQLARHRGNVSEVARTMGKARMQVQRWCRRFGIDPRLYRPLE
jgi:transcriptional regulator with AAA-type ATPase domain